MYNKLDVLGKKTWKSDEPAPSSAATAGGFTAASVEPSVSGRPKRCQSMQGKAKIIGRMKYGNDNVDSARDRHPPGTLSK